MNELTAKKNTEYCDKALNFKSEIEGAFLVLGEMLGKIRDQKLYEPNYETFDEFLLEMKMSAASASKLINISQVFVVQYKFSQKRLGQAGGWTVLAELLPLVGTKKEADHWLDHAIHNSRADLRKELNQKKTGVNDYNCKHPDHFVLKICRNCKGREVIKDTRKDGKK